MAVKDTGTRSMDASHAQGVQVGDHGTQNNIYHLPQRPPITWPHLVGVLPKLAGHRQDRPADHDLAALLAEDGERQGERQAAAACQVLTGMGGVGKTQLAAAYAHHTWNHGGVDLLVWVTATSSDAVITSYDTAATNITGIKDPDPAQGAERFLTWLAEPHHQQRHTRGLLRRPRTPQPTRWLIVLDDLPIPGGLIGLWPPTVAWGRVIVTTRYRGHALAQGCHPIQIGVFTPEQSLAYLTAKLGTDPARLAEADLLAADLGHLPLALAQATTYILHCGLTCTHYRRRLTDRRKRLDDLVPDPRELPDQHPNTIAATWSLSIDLADSLRPVGLARPLLEIAALLDPNIIPADLFTTIAVRTHLASRRDSHDMGPIDDSDPASDPPDPDDVLDVLHGLHRLNVLTLDPNSSTLRIHALIQRAVHETTATTHAAAAAITAANALVEIWPEIEHDPVVGQMLRANTAALHTAAGPRLWDTSTGVHPVLIRAGTSLGQSGQAAAATSYYRDLSATAEQHLGREHISTLTIRARATYWQGIAGDPAGALTAFGQLLPDLVRELGSDHPDTLIARSHIAYFRGEAGDTAGAAAAAEEVLPDLVRVLGTDHPYTLAARGEPPYWHGRTGDASAASTADAFEHLLLDTLPVLGPDHFLTLCTRREVASWRGQAGDPASAATALRQLLPDMERVLGADNPTTLAARGEFARWRGHATDPAAAVATLGQLLSDQIRVLGPDHIDTLYTRGSLACWQGRAGNAADAANALQQLLSDQIRVLGPDHPHTMTTRHNLANWQAQASNPSVTSE